ncbi:MAG: 8-oxo-dGTP diphosphatase, partial [Parcubacteria group bacterium]|nr:8-oxo-dGTP diphosphatase [Parcubacteria group bacterium]
NDGARVLIGMKKRGFGQGRWNGFGGKVKDGETIDAAASRELREEVGVVPVDLRKAGLADFYFDDGTPDIRVHVFCATQFLGEPRETEEMRPQWFKHREIPFGDMWPDDEHWFPHFLKGSFFRGTFRFRDIDTLLEHDVRIV